MFILSEDEKTIINTDKVSRLVVQPKPELTLLVAVIDDEPIAIGRYANINEAKNALFKLGMSLSNNNYLEQLNPSSYPQYKQHKHGLHGEKKKTHGAS